MRNIISFIILLLATHLLSAQSLTREVVASAGETFQSNTLYLDWTLGELMTESYTGSIALTQGFHQTKVTITSIEDQPASLRTIKVYPNPTRGSLSIVSKEEQDLKITLLDLHGRILMNKSLSSGLGYLDLSDLPNGMYVLRLTDAKHGVQSVKIEKY